MFLYCQVSNINRPSAYETAIKEKEAARENIKVSQSIFILYASSVVEHVKE